MWRFRKSRNVGQETPERKLERRGRVRKVLIWIERLLLIPGLALATFYSAARLESWFTSRASVNQFATEQPPAETRKQGEAQNPHDARDSFQELELPEVDFGLWDKGRVKAYERSVAEQSGVPLAVLRIPRIHLEAPLFDDTGKLTLNHGVGRIAGTSRPGETGNIGIAGHRDGFFRGLENVSVGDVIELKTRQGTAEYTVDEIQIVTPQHVEVLRPTAIPSLTLVTCYPFYFFGSAPQRYIVTASLSQEKNGEAGNTNLSTPTFESNSTRRKQMKLFKKAGFFGKGAGAIVLGLVALGTVAAQDSSVTTITHGQPSFDTQVKNAEIVYVEGNDLVLKLENGRIEHLIVPNSDKFTIDGKEVGVQELVPGTKLTQTITTMTTPRYVNTVRTIEGKVWHVSAPNSVILTLPDNKNQRFNLPSDAKFTLDGREKTAFDLRKGMKIKATIVTDEEHTVVESNKLAYGQAPRVATPAQVGVLLFVTPPPSPVTLASAEQPADTLPETGSPLPLLGLLGTLAIVTSLGVRAVRQARGI
jgi:sortase A